MTNETTPGQSGPPTDARLSVEAAVRVIAAGVFERRSNGTTTRRVRATLVLTPVPDPTAGTPDLSSWPAEVDAVLKKGVTVNVWPLDSRAGRDVKEPKFKSVIMTAFRHPLEKQLNALWQTAMGEASGLHAVACALTPPAKAPPANPPPPLAADAPADAEETMPGIFGTERSAAAVALSLERAYHILDRLAGRSTDTRPPLPQVAGEPDPLPKPDKANQASIDEEIVKRNADADNAAWDRLGDSRTRAKATAAARRAYHEMNDPVKALEALATTADCHAGRRSPEACARALHAAPQAGPQIEEAHAAYRLSSSPPLPEPGKPQIAAPAPLTGANDDFARRRLFALQAHPSLARLFRFVVDVECDLEVLLNAFGGLPPLGREVKVLDHDVRIRSNALPPEALPEPKEPAEPRFLLLSATLPAKGGTRLPPIWTTAKLRMGGPEGTGPAHFYPCTREEIDAFGAGVGTDLRGLAIAEQIDGMVDLGQESACPDGREPRFDIVTLDSITAIASDENEERARALRPANGTDPPRGTLRTMGLALIDRWRQNHVIARHVVAASQPTEETPSTGGFRNGILFDASDLTVGYKLDVGVLSKRDPKNSRRRWHTLMRRNVAFRLGAGDGTGEEPPIDKAIDHLYPDKLARLRADDGMLTVAAAWREDLKIPKAHMKRAVFTEEIIGAWRGDPLGLACTPTETTLDARDLKIGMVLSLPTNRGDQDFTPPPLRFGWRYHFGLRAVYAGGVSIPLERALGHYERSHDGKLVLPPVSEPGRIYRRHERIDTPILATPEWAFVAPGTQPVRNRNKEVQLPRRTTAEQTRRMVVRTIRDRDNARLLGLAEPKQGGTAQEAQIARRVLIPPAVGLDFASMHGVFDDGAEMERNVVRLEPRWLRSGQAEPDEMVAVEWVPRWDRQGSEPRQVWTKEHVAWRRTVIASRPKGGLSWVDYNAAWGGFPIFRMKHARSSAPDPQEGAPVPLPSPELTDLGEIVDRGDSIPLTFSGPGNIKIKADPEWSARSGVPSGSAVFRPLNGGRAKEPRRTPYYPDPAATHLVLQVEVKGGERQALFVQFYGGEARENTPKPPQYPHVIPVVLDVVRQSNGPRALIAFADGKRNKVWAYSDKASLDPLHAGAGGAAPAVRHVIVQLQPGEEATIRAWCIPSPVFLQFMFEGTESAAALAVACGCGAGGIPPDPAAVNRACQAGMAALCGDPPAKSDGAPPPAGSVCGQGVGGLRLPTQSEINKIADRVHRFMQENPMTEIAAVEEIEAVHAVDLPEDEPTFVADAQAPVRLLRVPASRIQAILTAKAGTEPLRDPRRWSLKEQVPEAVDVLLSGRVRLHGPTTGAIEILATTAAAARGRFDDTGRGRSRDDRARGIWPQPDGRGLTRPEEVFGFLPHSDGRVTLRRETVPLLRIEGFGPKINEIDLLQAQECAAHGGDIRALRFPFPDGRARYVELSVVAVSRHGSVLRTRYDELPEILTTPQPQRPESRPPPSATQYGPPRMADARLTSAARHSRGLWLPATVRPARIVPLSLIPSFRWSEAVSSTAGKDIAGDGVGVTTRGRLGREVSVTRRPNIRVRMQRPWFSSGEGERIGIVLWPPHLFDLDAQDVRQDVIRELVPGAPPIQLNDLPDDGGNVLGLQDADLGPGGAWVTRWGADPIRPGNLPQGWLLSPDNFKRLHWGPEADWTNPPGEELTDGVIVPHALMPVPLSMDALESRAVSPPGGFMSVTLVTYQALFDAEQEIWYADVELNALGVDSPFVRMGLVRYQPHAPTPLRVSEPTIGWTQILPVRTVKAIAEPDGPETTRIIVRASGAARERGDKGSIPETSSAQRSVMRMMLVRRHKSDGQDHGETVVAEALARSSIDDNGVREWCEEFQVRTSDFRARGLAWLVYVEEVDRLRPATYVDEPRPDTAADDDFAETGPRFAAMLDLEEIRHG
ncbi:hypothetical protein [Azospirillum sp.]|uniref:hypothetical protein n=1 Tax=Azospirillum sp. TaxID=34012 RepID=UPI002D259C8F|nr:hypothetical protein [Azospirillum sp.]HYD69915.1 hypothetical protein [Azospirillum sp.]